MELWLLAIPIAALLGWVSLVAWRGVGIAAPASSTPRPTRSRAEALARLAELQAREDDTVAAACRSQLLEANGGSDVTVVIWHGFTNCPSQFQPIAEQFLAAGYNVLLARIPRHGLADVLNRDLLNLTADELVEHADTCIDIAAGLGSRVWVVGLSAGGVLAAWAAAFRPEVRRAVLAAPFVAPKGIPVPVVRLLIRFRRLIPALYFWWDPRKKENLGESPYVYPGFPLPGMVPFLHVAEALYDRKVVVSNRLRRVVLLSNPGDFAIRRDVARTFVFRAFEGHSDYLTEATLDESLGWWHDFVDPWGPHVGSREQVAQVFFSLLGVAEEPSASGAIVEPLPAADGPDSDGVAA